MNNFYLPLVLSSVFVYASSGAVEVYDRMGELGKPSAKITVIIAAAGNIIWLLWIAAFFVAVKWWHVPVLFAASYFGNSIYNILVRIVAFAGDKALKLWLLLSTLATLPLIIWTIMEMWTAW